MSEPTAPDSPEPPELIKWLRWLAHYFSRESQVIRGAPIAFAVAVTALAALGYLFAEWRHGDTIALKDATIENQRTRIATLEGELKGASPQLAAIQTRRAALRQQLLDFYIEVGPIIERGKWPQFKDDSEYKAQLENDVTAWEKKATQWINNNLGAAARERFLDISNMPTYSWTPVKLPSGNVLPSLMNQVVNERKNLALLIETSAYDK